MDACFCRYRGQMSKTTLAEHHPAAEPGQPDPAAFDSGRISVQAEQPALGPRGFEHCLGVSAAAQGAVHADNAGPQRQQGNGFIFQQHGNVDGAHGLQRDSELAYLAEVFGLFTILHA